MSEIEDAKNEPHPNQAKNLESKRVYSWFQLGTGGVLTCEGQIVYRAESYEEAMNWLDERQTEEHRE